MQSFTLWQKAIHFVSGEWMISSGKRANGGAVIAARTTWTSGLLFAGVIILGALLPPPGQGFPSSLDEFVAKAHAAARSHFEWFGALFAALYATYYSRFSSQWTYLSGLYNQIKEAESKARCDQKLCEWKAAFLEDAETLHLSTKPLFRVTTIIWGEDPGVAEAYDKTVPGGRLRLGKLIDRAKTSMDPHDLRQFDEQRQAARSSSASLPAEPATATAGPPSGPPQN